MPILPVRAVLVVLALGAATHLPAQQAPVPLEPGDTVRVVAPSLAPRRVDGRIVSYRADTLTVREEGTGTAYAFPLASIRSLAKNEGRDRDRSIRRSARFGTFLGLAVGLVSGPFIAREGDRDRFGTSVAASTAGGAVVGAALGAGLGALFPRDRWRRVRIPHPPEGAPR